MNGMHRIAAALAAGVAMATAWRVEAQTAPRGPDAPRRAPAQERVDPFQRFDANGDGKLAGDEMPPFVRERLQQIDGNGDGAVTREEMDAFRRGQGRAVPPGDRRGPPQSPLPPPDLADISYGPHPRNVFDLWKAPGGGPHPLVIYYHGGGFRGGDKRTLNASLLQGLLAKGVSVVAANYRLSDAAPYPAQMHDAARTLQFIRLHAAEYGIDPARVGGTGGSAGAGISQWLLFHDDLADAKSEDPLARQSTRLQCAVVYAAQTSYDPRFHKELFQTEEVEQALIAFFGMRSPADAKDPKFFPLFEDSSPINHATADDGPVMLFYPQANDPLPPNAPGGRFIHHPKFGEVLKEKLDKLGVECVLKFREDYAGQELRGGPVEDYISFFVAKLKP